MAENKYGPQKRFREKHSKQYNLVCFLNTEKDIVDRLEEVPNRSGYIKDLIRRDTALYEGTYKPDLIAYPARFVKEYNGYSVFFPDIENCFTCGDSIAEALYMAQDVLALTLRRMETDYDPLPVPSDIQSIEQPTEGFVSLVFCDRNYYREWDKWYVPKKRNDIN